VDIKGKVVFITGASSGFGRELARIASGMGASVVLAARKLEALEQLAGELGAKGGQALAVRADVCDRSSLDAAVEAALARFGRIDVLVNNAGLGFFGPIETMPMEDFDRVAKTNVYGLISATQAALPALKASRGMVVNVSSGLAHRALPFLSAYAGTKAMVNALSDGLRLELAPYGIRVLNYCPPAADSGFGERSIKGPGMAPGGMGGMRMARSEEVAAKIAAVIRSEKPRSGGASLRLMNFLAPGLMDRMFAGIVRKFGAGR
jgi:NAD(P)-dependent dehydrogenase (short-subunit alcohol dehydrogenase family)